MPIEVTCPSCGDVRRVKDEHAGRAFRCKVCQAKVQIPEAESDDIWDDDFGSTESYEEYGDESENPFAAPKPKKRKSKSGKNKKRKRRQSDSMPVGVIIALVILWLNFGLNVLGTIMNIAGGENDAAYIMGQIFGNMISIAFPLGIQNRSNVVRWITVGLNGLFLMCGGCAVAFTLPAIGELLGGGGLAITIAVVGFVFSFSLAVIIGLSIESSNDWFTN